MLKVARKKIQIKIVKKKKKKKKKSLLLQDFTSNVSTAESSNKIKQTQNSELTRH